jgi:hypothetical protein
MSNLLDQWNEHIVRGNQLSRELENIEALIEKSRGEEICFTAKPNGSTYIGVLSPEKMQELRESVLIAIFHTRDAKAAELEKLMGVRKPATNNPEFEAAVQEMERSHPTYQQIVQSIEDKNRPFPTPATQETLDEIGKQMIAEPDLIETALTEVLQEEARKIEQPKLPQEDKSFSKYPAKKSDRGTYPEGMTEKAVKELYINQGKTISEVAKHFNVPYGKANSFITGHKLFRNPKQPAETERP